MHRLIMQKINGQTINCNENNVLLADCTSSLSTSIIESNEIIFATTAIRKLMKKVKSTIKTSLNLLLLALKYMPIEINKDKILNKIAETEKHISNKRDIIIYFP